MKIAVVGSRGLHLSEAQLKKHLFQATEIVSGGAKGADACAAAYAQQKGILLTEFLPQYQRFGRAAPLVRNRQIVDYADQIIAFWDGTSNGTRAVIDYAKRTGKACEVIFIEQTDK